MGSFCFHVEFINSKFGYRHFSHGFVLSCSSFIFRRTTFSTRYRVIWNEPTHREPQIIPSANHHFRPVSRPAPVPVPRPRTRKTRPAPVSVPHPRKTRAKICLSQSRPTELVPRSSTRTNAASKRIGRTVEPVVTSATNTRTRCKNQASEQGNNHTDQEWRRGHQKEEEAQVQKRHESTQQRYNM